MKKRILTSLLALTLCLGLTTGALAAESTSLRISAPETLPDVGETFTVTVSIAENPGVCAVQFTLASDSAVVDCVSAEIGSVLTGALAASNPDAPDGAIIAAANTRTMTKDGTLGVFTYRVVSDGDPDLRLEDVILAAGDGKTISCTVKTELLPEEKQPEAETGQAGDGIGGSKPQQIINNILIFK